jgi:hypothetical protein
VNVVHIITGAVRSNFGASALAGSVLPAGSRCLLSVRRCVCARLGESASQVRGAAALHQRTRDIVTGRRRDGCDRLRVHGRGGCAERRAGVGCRCGRQRVVLSYGRTVHAKGNVGKADLAEARPPLARLDGTSKWEPVCVGRIDRCCCNWDCSGRCARRWRVGQRAEGHDHVPPSRTALKFASSASSGSASGQHRSRRMDRVLGSRAGGLIDAERPSGALFRSARYPSLESILIDRATRNGARPNSPAGVKPATTPSG